MRAAVVFAAAYAISLVVSAVVMLGVAARTGESAARASRSLTIVLWFMVLTWTAGVIVVTARLGRSGISPSAQWAVGAGYALTALLTVALLGLLARIVFDR